MLIRQYLGLVLLRAAARAAWRLIRMSAAAAVLVAAAPGRPSPRPASW